MHEQHEPIFCSIADAAKVLAISPSYVRKMVHDGRLDARTISGRIVIPVATVREFADSLPKFERAPQ